MSTNAVDLLEGPSLDAPIGAELARAKEHAEHGEGVHVVRQLFGGDTRYLIGFGLQMVTGSVVTPILTRVLGSSSYGRVAAAIAVMQVLVTLEGLGFAAGIQRATALSGQRAGRAALFITALSAVAFTVVLLASMRWWAAGIGFGSARAVLEATVIWSGLSAFTQCALALLRSLERLAAFNAVNVVQTLVAQTIGIGLALSVPDRLLGYLVGIVLAQGVAAFMALRSTRPVLSFWREPLAGIFLFSLPLLPQQLATFVLNASDRLVIQRDLGSVPVGRYQVAYSLAGVAILIVALLGQTWIPSLLKYRNSPQFEAVLAAARDKLGYMLIPAVLGLCAGLPVLMRYWVPSRYDPATLTTVIVLVSLSTIPFGLFTSGFRVLFVEGSTLAISGATVLSALVNVALNLVLVPRYGIDGSAWATLVAYGVLWVTTALLARSARYRIPPNPRLGLALVATTVLAALSPHLGLTGDDALLRWFAAGVCVIVLVRMLRFASGHGLAPESVGGGTPGSGEGVVLLDQAGPTSVAPTAGRRPLPQELPVRRSRGALLGLASVLLGLAAALSVVAPGRPTPVLVAVFLLVGVSTVPLQLRHSVHVSGDGLAEVGPALALGVVVAGGFALVELHWWHPDALAAVVGAATIAVHTWRIAVPDLSLALGEDLALLRERLLRVPLLLTLAGVGVCVGTGIAQYPLTPGPDGMFSTLDWPWYLGFALCAVAVAFGLRQARRSNSKVGAVDLAVPVLVLVSLVSLTTAVVYQEPRFVWLSKHIGVTEYILHYHSVNPAIDIYQAWPGLFSATAWFTTVAHIGDPLTVARWFPPVIDMATALVVRRLARQLLADDTVAWLAAVLFGLALSFGQDYFSPQALGLLFGIGILSLAIGPRHRPFDIGALVFLSLISAVVHQLSPYAIFGALVVLVLFRFVRPIWVPLIELVPALAWAISHYAAWKIYVMSGLFDISSNTALVRTSGEVFPQRLVVHLGNYTLAAGCALVGSFALIRIISRRDRMSLCLGLCALSPIALLFATSYGGEADNRVVFFAMPWCAILAADWCWSSQLRSWLPGLLAVVLSATSFVAVTSLDWAYVESPAAVAAERYVETHAPAGSMIVSAGSADASPASITYRYPDFGFYSLADLAVLPELEQRYGAQRTAALTAKYLPEIVHATGYYIVSTPTIDRFDDEKGIDTPADYQAFVNALNHSPDWRLIFHLDGASVWQRVG